MRIHFSVIEKGADVPNVVVPKLSHGNTVAEVVDGTEELVDTDGVWTRNRALTLGVTTADCASIAFSDGEKIGIAHVGWRGFCLGLVEQMLSAFDKATLAVFVGPHLHSFEVKKDGCYEQIFKKCGNTFFEYNDDIIMFRFTGALRALLPVGTHFDERNTETDMMLPSYRHGRNKTRLITSVRI